MEQNRQFRATSTQIFNLWDPRANEKNGFAYNANDPNNTLEGYIIGCKEGVGIHGSTVWEFHEVLSDGKLGEKGGIFGDKVLNGELYKEKIGAYVRLTYKGKAFPKGKPAQQFTKNNSYHVWEVMVDDNAIPYNQANPGANIKTTPTVNQNQNVTPQVNQGPQQQPVQNKGRFGGGNQQQQNNNAGSFAQDDLPF